MEKALDIKFSLANNVKAMAFAEQLLEETPSNSILLKYGPGVCSAIVIDDKIFRRL